MSETLLGKAGICSQCEAHMNSHRPSKTAWQTRIRELECRAHLSAEVSLFRTVPLNVADLEVDDDDARSKASSHD
jgi:hypothetical protein